MQTILIPIIGIHRSPLTQKFGTPRQPNLVAVPSHIEMLAPFDTPDAFVGIHHYSHLWIVWQFHHNKAQDHFRPQVRPPRLGGNQKMGVFATRSMYRPSGLGLSVVALDSIEQTQGKLKLFITGADFIDATPIVDIKPYLPYSDSVDARSTLDKPIPKTVQISTNCQQNFHALIEQGVLQTEDIAIITDLIAHDPRPAYRQADTDIFFMAYKTVDIGFCLNHAGGFTLINCALVNQRPKV